MVSETSAPQAALAHFLSLAPAMARIFSAQIDDSNGSD
jgi:hypothetical protein